MGRLKVLPFVLGLLAVVVLLPFAFADPPNSNTVQTGAYVNFNGINYLWVPGNYGGSCYVSVTATNCTGVQTSTPVCTTCGAPPPPSPGPSGGGSTVVTVTTGSNGLTTTVLANATGNPANIPTGLLVVGAVLGLVFVPAFVQSRKRKGRTYTVDLRNEPRLTRSVPRETRLKSRPHHDTRLKSSRPHEARRTPTRGREPRRKPWSEPS